MILDQEDFGVDRGLVRCVSCVGTKTGERIALEETPVGGSPYEATGEGRTHVGERPAVATYQVTSVEACDGDETVATVRSEGWHDRHLGESFYLLVAELDSQGRNTGR